MAKEFVFGFKIAAALQGNFSGVFSMANSKITELDNTIRKYTISMNQVKKAYQDGILSQNSYHQQMDKLKPEYDILIAKQKQMVTAQQKLNTAKSNMLGNGVNILEYAGIATALSTPINKAIDFESAMADVKKVVDFDTPVQFKEMNKDILELSKNIPITAQGLAQIVAAGGQSGIAREDLLAFAESAAKMGVAFDVTADQAGQMMAQWRTAFKMGQTDVVALADKINYLGNNTAASADKISDVVTRIGPLGEIGGVASGEIAALGASMVSTGVQSDVAATGIKNLILGMASGEGATKSQAAAFEKLGFSSTEMAKRMQVDAKGAILDVMKALQALPKEEQTSTLSALFGNESISAIAPLLSNLDALQKNMQMVGDSTKYAGSMEKEFKDRADTTANSITLMKQRMDAAQITIGNGLIPVITPFLEGLSVVVSKAGELAQEFPTATTAIGGAGLALVTLGAIGNAGLWIWNGLKVAFNATKLAILQYNLASKAATVATTSFNTAAKLTGITFRTTGTAIRQYTSISKSATILTKGWTIAQGALNIAFSANPIGAFVLAATALVGVGYLVYQNWDTVKQFFIGFWGSPIAAILAFLGGPITMLLYTGSLIIANWDAVKAWFTLLWENPKLAISQFVDYMYNTFGGALDWAENKWNTLKAIFDQPLTVTVKKLFLGDDSNTEVDSNASGGIYGRGAFLTTFAEKSGESAIPHTPNRRNIGLLAKTNAIMGNPLGQSGNTITATFAPQITIQGNGDTSNLNSVLEQKMREFESMLNKLQSNQRRLSYA